MTLGMGVLLFASFVNKKTKKKLTHPEWKQHNVRKSDARNFKLTLLQNVTNTRYTSKWNKTHHIDLWTKEHWPSDPFVTTCSYMHNMRSLIKMKKSLCCLWYMKQMIYVWVFNYLLRFSFTSICWYNHIQLIIEYSDIYSTSQCSDKSWHKEVFIVI